jgi:hypothetical protein
VIEARTFPGLIEWTEKLIVILSSLSVVGEYFFVGIRHHLKTNNICETEMHRLIQHRQKNFNLNISINPQNPASNGLIDI